MPECACVGRNCDWADNRLASGGQYACPRCGVQYHAWLAGTSGRLRCNKVMVVHCLLYTSPSPRD
eukprot:3272364-Alexandrium_andersonii.AAC.1